MNYRVKHLASKSKLAALVEQHCPVTIFRNTVPFEDQISGYLLDFSNNLLLIHATGDFRFEGYKILRMQDVTNYQHSELDKFADFVMDHEGLLGELPCLYKVDIASWKSVAKSMMKLNLFTIVENERSEMFAVGKVLDVMDDGFQLAPMDNVGVWVPVKLNISYDDITCVSFDCTYSRMMKKYGKSETEMPNWDEMDEGDFGDGEDEEDE